ncbi:hypothetical protein GGR56DRAFT_642880 [Xylariaceae sp. FL0804]|nr:hypothetical protein GGR56DRAFT_642880 [Xylariaceae sp. FL0804]
MHLPAPVPSDDGLYLHINAVRDMAEPALDPLEDVFASPSLHDQPHQAEDISLDSRRLQSQHATVGYREGITAGKAGSIQAGFDQGFSLGANIGLKAGELLGMLEAIAAALRGRDAHREESARLECLLLQATRDLDVAAIFDGDYWAADGTWKYPVNGPEGPSRVSPEDVASSHPTVARWTALVDKEARRWHLDRSLPVLRNYAAAEDGVTDKPAQPREVESRGVEW